MQDKKRLGTGDPNSIKIVEKLSIIQIYLKLTFPAPCISENCLK